MEDNSESIEFIDDVTEEKLKLKEKYTHKHNDKIDASNLQSKSFSSNIHFWIETLFTNILKLISEINRNFHSVTGGIE